MTALYRIRFERRIETKMATVPAIALTVGHLDLATITVGRLRLSGAVRLQTPRSPHSAAQYHPKNLPRYPAVSRRTPVTTISETLHHLKHTLGLIVGGLRYPGFPIDDFGYRALWLEAGYLNISRIPLVSSNPRVPPQVIRSAGGSRGSKR